MTNSWLATVLLSLSVLVATVYSASAPMAQIYTDLSKDPAVQNACQQGCRICLEAIDSSTNAYYQQISQSTGLHTFIQAYKNNKQASNNSNSLDGYTILSNGWDSDPLLYGITNGFNLYGVPTTGPVFDGSAASIGDVYSWLNGQFYHIHVDRVNAAGNQASLWARTRDSSAKIYASSGIRTPKCTFWGMASTVYPPAPGPWGLFQVLNAYNCSNWAKLLGSKQCNGQIAAAMFSQGTLFALPNEIFDESRFDIGKWGYNNGTNSSDAWCNFISYHATQQALPFQNGSASGSVNSQYSVNGTVHTIEYQYSLEYNNSDGAAFAVQMYNGHAVSISGSVPIWLNNQNGSTLNVISTVLDPKNKTNPSKPVNPRGNETSTDSNFGSIVTFGYSTLVVCMSLITMFALPWSGF